MSGAKANRAYIASVKEASWGITPDTPTLQKINFVSDSLNYALETTTPESIRDDRMVSDVINVSAGNEGGYELEFQALQSGPDDDHLVAALWAEEWVGDATVKTDVEGAVVTVAGSQIDFGAGTAQPTAMSPGDKFLLYGTLNKQNNGIYTVVTAPGADVYTVAEAFAADETLPAGAGQYNGQYIKNGLVRHSFTIERGHADVTEYFVYTGMAVNEFNLSFEAGAIVTGGYTFVGKETDVVQAPIGTLYEDAPTTPFMSAGFNVMNVMIDGAPVPECYLQSVELGINNNLTGKMAVGNFGYCDTSEGEFELSGEIGLYFNDSSMYQNFITSTAFSFSFDLVDNDGNAYRITVPKAKLSADAVNVEGKNTDVMDAAEYMAIYDETEGAMIRIDRFYIADL